MWFSLLFTVDHRHSVEKVLEGMKKRNRMLDSYFRQRGILVFSAKKYFRTFQLKSHWPTHWWECIRIVNRAIGFFTVKEAKLHLYKFSAVHLSLQNCVFISNMFACFCNRDWCTKFIWVQKCTSIRKHASASKSPKQNAFNNGVCNKVI